MKQTNNKKYLNPELSAEERAEDLLSRLSLMEKIGQMNQIWGLEQMKELGGPDPEEMAAAGMAGSMLYVLDAKTKNRFQKAAVEKSPSGIPIMYGSDVTHGYLTGFPSPLAMSCSWEPSLLEEAQHAAAAEARKDGIHWTFFPNADIARDLRWGRVTETMGEDPYLTSRMVAAQVKGFQGNDISAPDRVLSCVKHFAGYGACTGGRDYDAVFLPEAELRNTYLPPFKAGLDAGCGSLMTAYMDLNNVPATANQFLMNQVLRKEWQYDGLVVTDAGTVGSLVTQGFAKDGEDAAERAVNCGVSMDMGSFQYIQHLAKLVAENRVQAEAIDSAVRSILIAKFRLGLFEHPYVDEDQTEDAEAAADRRVLARAAARKSIVLLKNENHMLPLAKEAGKVAVIGPLADARDDLEGILGMTNVPQAVTVVEGIRAKLGAENVLYAPGPWIRRDIPSITNAFVPDFCGKGQKNAQTDEEAQMAFEQAVDTASKADLIVMALGETREMSGEGSSRSDIGLPGRQLELLKKVSSLGKPVILLLIGGRPLSCPWAQENVPAILECWQLGWEAGNAIADILFGDAVPSGKLTMTVPRSAAQCPAYYAQNLTHVPVEQQPAPYSRYWNESGAPLYPFGYGLSYTSFAYENIRTSAQTVKLDETVTICADVKNTGSRAGDETAQFYIHQRFGSDSRPKRLLRGFQKIHLEPGETKTVTFRLTPQDRTYFSSSKDAYIQDLTEFDVWIGADSKADLMTTFRTVE